MMRSTFLIVGLTMFIVSSPSIAQNSGTLPKASKADVQKVVDAIKADKAKMALFCDVAKLEKQAANADNDEKKQKEIGAQIDAASQKVGPDFAKINSSDLPDDAAGLLDDLAQKCGG
jgi:hypothetical protein